MGRIWCAPNNASKWQMGFKSAFKGLKSACSNVAVCIQVMDSYVKLETILSPLRAQDFPLSHQTHAHQYFHEALYQSMLPNI